MSFSENAPIFGNNTCFFMKKIKIARYNNISMEYELTKMEKRILRFIVVNGIPNSEKAVRNKLKISPLTFSYKLKKLRERNIIAGHKYAIDFRKLGLPLIAWILITLKRTFTDLERLMDILLSYPEVHIVAVITGDYDIAVKVYGKSVAEISNFVRGLECDIKQFVESVNTIYLSRVYKNHNMLLQNTDKVKFSSAELKILNERMKQPDESVKEIAERLEMHRNTVGKKWKSIISKGIVLKKGIRLNPDYAKDVGTAFSAIALIHTVVGAKETIANELAKLDEIHELGETSFPADLILVVRVADINEFYEFYQRLFNKKIFIENICSARSFVIMKSKVHKQDYIEKLGEDYFLGE